MSSKIQQIFQSVKERSPQTHFPFNKTKVLDAISICRTPQMGGFVQQCEDCDHTEAHFHSCRNRHCTICQGLQQELWVEKQFENTLPIPYFHVVFTLPSELNPLVLANPAALYNLLFKAASRTILTLSKDQKFLGAQAGFTAVLHSWGRNIQFHPHLHCIVAGGGLSMDKTKFIRSRESFFLPVKVMSKVFRGKFLDELKNILNRNQLVVPEQLSSPYERQALVDKLYSTDWVVYCKKPFKEAYNVIRYLGRYTHKVAISESRIVSYDPESRLVRFKWKDYKSGNRIKIMELSEDEFVRRFLLHVLPTGFMKIRHYGFLGNKNRKATLEVCRDLLKATKPRNSHLPLEKKQELQHCCPKCGSCSFQVVFSSPRYQKQSFALGAIP